MSEFRDNLITFLFAGHETTALGLTYTVLSGLAQVNDIKSTNPSEKLRLDLKYIRKQSFAIDTGPILPAYKCPISYGGWITPVPP